MIILLTETYACQTCFIPITNYFQAFARLWLHISSCLIRNQYISEYAPFIRPLSRLTAEKDVGRNTECRIDTPSPVNSSAVSTKQLSSAVAFQEGYLVQEPCVTSVHRAWGSPKDHIPYRSTPGAVDLLPACSKIPVFSRIIAMHQYVCDKIKKIQRLAKRVKMETDPIEPLRVL